MLTLVTAGPPPVIVSASGTSTGRIDLLTQPLNLAVPGHTVADALSKRPDFPVDSMTDLVLGFPGLLSGISRSQVEWAEALNPTTIILWIGNNDVLNAAITGTTAALTPVDQFEVAYSNVVKRLAATGASLVIANIPDVSVIPYVVSVPEAAAMFGAPVNLFAAALGMNTNDFLTLDTLPTAAGILQGTITGPLTDNEILTAAEVQQIQEATRQFNSIIARYAKLHHAVLVDTAGFLTKLDRRGLVVGGQRLKTGYLGGIFSLDGIHPTNTGAAATANEFIRTINRCAHTAIPPVSVRQIEKNDPLVPQRIHRTRS